MLSTATIRLECISFAHEDAFFLLECYGHSVTGCRVIHHDVQLFSTENKIEIAMELNNRRMVLPTSLIYSSEICCISCARGQRVTRFL